MRKIRLFLSLALAICLTGCNANDTAGPVGPQGEQGLPGEAGPKGDNGEKGERGQDGSSVFTGHGSPITEIGSNLDSYIDLDTWNYYIKESNNWEIVGNIKGKDGINGIDGVSVESARINEDGDLIVSLSNGTSVNCGNLVNNNYHKVDFYCGDILVGTSNVRHNEKVIIPEFDDFIVSHWYIDREFQHEWLQYGCVVTEDMTIFGDYKAIPKHVLFDKTSTISIDEYGFGFVEHNEKEICVSKGTETNDYLSIIESRGIIFNKSEIGLINKLNIDIANDGFDSARIYYGKYPFSFDNSIDLIQGLNEINLNKAEYFTIQNSGTLPIKVKNLDIEYERKAVLADDSLPTVVINTKNEQEVTSRTEYVDCTVSTIGAEIDVNALKAQIKLRGNTTAQCPKKPYRIKLDKKNSLFGYAKAKNFALLAEYMDGSNMHNYTALKFAKLIRGEDTFGANPLHVNLILNGENVGLYTFCEHIDAKEGRLDIEQDNIWEKSFDEINFYIERDLSTSQDSFEIEGETYFNVSLENYPVSKYCFALKYPEKEDFEEKLDGGLTNPHEEEFQAFFNQLVSYMTDICNKFVDYYNDFDAFTNVASSVDVESLARYSVIDQAFDETDHSEKSFKMYRKDGGLLQFGPNWDYDSCAYGLPFKNTYVLNPFEVSYVSSTFHSTWFGEKWGYRLYIDVTNGKPLFKSIWDNISASQIDTFVAEQVLEMKSISHLSMYDCDRWMNRQYYALFDNLLYHWSYIGEQLYFLKTLYS